MKIFFRLLVALTLIGGGLRGGWAETLIPAPGASQAGYFVQFNDAATGVTATTSAAATTPVAIPMPSPIPTTSVPVPRGLMAPGAVSSGVWDGAVSPASMGSASGCNDCAQLWQGACDVMAESACDGICGGSCDGGCGLWSHMSCVYGSLLYLRPRNADVAYAVPIDGPITGPPANNPIQIGSVGVVDPDFEVGFMAGLNLAVNSMTSLFAEITMLDSSTADTISTAAPDVLRSIVSHPSSTSAATDYLTAAANLDIEFDTLDVGLRHLFVGGQVFAVNYFVGARYSRLEQRFDATFVDNGTEQVATDIDFDGGGLRLGFDAERQSCRTRLRVYTRSSASFLAGRFRATYFQGQTFDPSVVNTSWEAGRIVPVLDLELGAGWSTPGGRVRLNGGYVVSAWFNTVQTEDFIHAVQQNDFLNLGDSLTFDGLRATAEVRF